MIGRRDRFNLRLNKTGRDRVTPGNLADPPPLGGRGVGLTPLFLRLNPSRGALLTSAASSEKGDNHEDDDNHNEAGFHGCRPF
jgi:hypothetical protein